MTSSSYLFIRFVADVEVFFTITYFPIVHLSNCAYSRLSSFLLSTMFHSFFSSRFIWCPFHFQSTNCRFQQPFTCPNQLLFFRMTWLTVSVTLSRPLCIRCLLGFFLTFLTAFLTYLCCYYFSFIIFRISPNHRILCPSILCCIFQQCVP